MRPGALSCAFASTSDAATTEIRIQIRTHAPAAVSPEYHEAISRSPDSLTTRPAWSLRFLLPHEQQAIDAQNTVERLRIDHVVTFGTRPPH